jgi:murein DD-endopeptidase MepM/ murein hydrolase activator NlpD
MAYVLPAGTDFVSCSWQCHRDRNPPSTEPGTDYGCGYGTIVVAAGNGVISDLKTSNSNATGRYCTVDMDDGRRTRTLHMAEIWVGVGQRVTQGQHIGLSGASGYGDDWYYGPHAHQTLWSCYCYNFCADCTIDFHTHVGPVVVEPTQRVVGSSPANGRSDPSTANPATQQLAAGTVANMDAWIHGENVSGNNVWFRGEFSGDYFWSGGFTDTGTHDLIDLNAEDLEPNERKALTAVNGRQQPNTTSEVIATLAAGAVGVFDGWVNGQSIEGEIRWLRGASSGAYFSLKYLEPANTDSLTDLNVVVLDDVRTTGENDVNVRQGPFTTFPVIDSLAPNTDVGVNGWAHGEDVQGEDIWYRIEATSEWAWAGGFTSNSTDGLDEIHELPLPPNANNPRGLPEYEPVNPAAVIGLEAPLGYNADGSPASRGLCGDDVVDPIIDRAIIHHTGTTVDQLDYFSYANSRSSCPTWYVRPDGSRIELIRPGHKPASTGPDWNCRSVAWEVLDETGDPTWLIPEAARRAVAEDIAWLAEFDGQTLDGVPVSFKIDAEHIIGHSTALPGSTICPGPDMDIPGIIVMAQAIYDESHPPIPPDCPDCPECPPDPGDVVEVDRAVLLDWRGQAYETIEEIDAELEGESRGRL